MFPSSSSSSSCRCFTLLFFFLIFIHQLSPSIANLHTLNTNPILKSSLRSPPPPSSPLSDDLTAAQSPPPTVFFEVTKPISVPNSQPCKYLILQHDFGFTYSKPPVIANYTFPSHCRRHGGFSKAVLEWNATCKGRQFDRIFGVWLSGVELLRSCTAEPRPNGIFWSVKKDITRYSSLLLSNDTLDFAVFLGNVVDSTYTGIYHVNVSIYFYSDDNEQSGTNKKLGPADLILPISRNLPLNDGLWFEIQNSNHESFKEFVIPMNVHRAVLEVYVSFHESDEFWFTNFPNDYIVANNISGALGNGPFREVVVSLDDNVTVGAVWPFTVIYTGGANPLLWRPISAIGSFDLPTYDIVITPFLGSLLDGKTHKLGFSVTNALNVWFIDANLHLWLDHQSARTEGAVINHRDRLDLSSQTNFKGLDGRFLTGATRIVSSKGWVKSSLGNITTHFTQRFSYDNVMELGKDGNLQTVRQVILSNDSSSSLGRSRNNFSLDFYSDFKEQPDNAGSYIINLTLGHDTSKSDSSSLRNRQSAQGVMLVKNNLVVSGVGATQQVYKYDSRESCYFRNISSFNYTILFDKELSSCSREKQQPPLGLKVAKLWPFPSRRRSFMSSSTSSSSSVLPDGH